MLPATSSFEDGSLAFSTAAGRDWKHADFLAIRHLDRGHPVAVQARTIVGENGNHVSVNYIMNVNSVSQIWRIFGAFGYDLSFVPTR
ncbi:MAG TPA: hypothetical protein VET85_09680 [Stellaceae bacterium]|nr:hypothetical protein [Stellaceae bacterium]